MKTQMPSPKEFSAAEKKLIGAGFDHIGTVMADNAKQEGVTDFGKLFVRSGKKFYLNFKTIGEVDTVVSKKIHDAGKESDLSEWQRP